jgi:hypothetical protein
MQLTLGSCSKTDLFCCSFNGQRAGNFCSASTVDYTVIFDKITDNAEGVVEGAFRLIDYL